MPDWSLGDPVPSGDIGTDVPHPARMYDYYLGGKDNFEADRVAADKAMIVVPDSQKVARTNREFLVRAVRTMADSGISQFIDLGTGFPTTPSVHEVAQARHPGSRVVYVDNDPVVVSHNLALNNGPGVVGIYGDIRDPGAILANPALTGSIDFARPVGVLFVAVLHFVTDADQPHDIVQAFRRQMAAGSMLAISHLTSDGTATSVMRAVQQIYSRATAPMVFRSAAGIQSLFGDMALLEPGVTEIQSWRPEAGMTRVTSTLRWLGGVAEVSPPDRKPPHVAAGR